LHRELARLLFYASLNRPSGKSHLHVTCKSNSNSIRLFTISYCRAGDVRARSLSLNPHDDSRVLFSVEQAFGTPCLPNMPQDCVISEVICSTFISRQLPYIDARR